MSHVQFCERFMAATRSDDEVALSELLHPDFLLEEPSGLPYSGTYHGVSGWRTLARAVVSAWSKFRIEPLEYPAESKDSLVVRFAISGRSRKTGKPFESTVLELWRFKDGKLWRILPHYFDTHLLASINDALRIGS
jgi:ketosteroid isomerase-like protein